MDGSVGNVLPPAPSSPRAPGFITESSPHPWRVSAPLTDVKTEAQGKWVTCPPRSQRVGGVQPTPRPRAPTADSGLSTHDQRAGQNEPGVSLTGQIV